MVRPKVSDFDDGTGNVDWDEYDETMGTYEDISYDEQKDREVEENDSKDG